MSLQLSRILIGILIASQQLTKVYDFLYQASLIAMAKSYPMDF